MENLVLVAVVLIAGYFGAKQLRRLVKKTAFSAEEVSIFTIKNVEVKSDSTDEKRG